ncbi:MAG: hypothetical protein ABIV43_02845 [Candidatus Saccharimonadales bacterium]
MNVGLHKSESQVVQECDDLMGDLSASSDAPTSEPVFDRLHEVLPEFVARTPAFRKLLECWVAVEPVSNVSYRIRKLDTMVHSLLIPDHLRLLERYPEDFSDSTDAFMTFLTENLTDRQNPQFLKAHHNLRRPYQRNVPQRAAVAALAGGIVFHRRPLEGGVVYHDWGAASNLTSRALAMYKFENVRMVHSDGTPDEDFANLFNTVAGRAAFQESIGIEALPPTTAADQEHIKACTIKPSQLNTSATASETEETYDLLVAAEFDSIRSIEGNFFRLDHDDVRMLQNNKSDVAIASFVFHQNQGRITRLEKCILPTIRFGGKLLVTDHLEIDPTDPQKLRILDRLDNKAQTVTTAILDTRNPEAGYKELVRWQSGELQVGSRGRDWHEFSPQA